MRFISTMYMTDLNQRKCQNLDFQINLSPSTNFSPLLLYLAHWFTVTKDVGKGNSFHYFYNVDLFFVIKKIKVKKYILFTIFLSVSNHALPYINSIPYKQSTTAKHVSGTIASILFLLLTAHLFSFEELPISQIGRGGHQGCILSPCLFNLYAEYIMRNAKLDETQAWIKIAGRNINYLRYADDTTLMGESKDELKSLFMKVKEES